MTPGETPPVRAAAEPLEPLPVPPATAPPPANGRAVAPNFITDIIDADLAGGRVAGVATRFPPEPNGYLHVGHAKSICLNFGIGEDYGGITYLRFDDTNPTTESSEYAEAIRADIDWLGFHYVDVRHASDYFPQLHAFAVTLIERGLAYVDSSSEEEIRALRGTVTEPGRPSPYRERSVEENLALFARMKAGEFAQGAHVLRAKIDLGAANMKMRDPILYRIVHASHYRTGDAWKIYPLYDFAHPLSDAIEGITHSLCTLEFENNREVYDWLVEHLIEGVRPHQYEFARLNLDHTVMSKRKLLTLVNRGHVGGWDDPRMPTLSAMRRKGVTPSAIKDFANRVGVAKANSRTDPALLDHSIRDDLNTAAPRVLAVLEPLLVELTNLPSGETTWLHADYWPRDVPKEGTRQLPLAREVVIERSDFEVEPSKGFKRLAPGRAVRLRHGPVIRCLDFETDAGGEVVKLRCEVIEDSIGSDPVGVKPSATVHWVSRRHGLPLTARLYQPLFLVPNPEADGADYLEHLNPDSLRVANGLIEPSVAEDDPDTRYQFERLGYFWRDPVDGRGAAGAERLIFNRIAALKDGFGARREEREAAFPGAGQEERAKRAERPERRERAERAERALPAASGAGAADTGGETPEARALRERHGLSVNDAGVLAANPGLTAFFEETLAAGADAEAAAPWVVNEVARELRERRDEDMSITPGQVAELVALVVSGTITNRVAKDLLAEVARSGASPQHVVSRRGLDRQLSEAELKSVVAETLSANADELASYRAGKSGLRGFFVGQVMSATKGQADPELVQRLVGAALDAG